MKILDGILNSGLPRWCTGKESTYQCRRLRFGTWAGKIWQKKWQDLEKENGSPLQYSCLGDPMDRGAQWATAHGVTKESDTI